MQERAAVILLHEIHRGQSIRRMLKQQAEAPTTTATSIARSAGKMVARLHL